MSKLNIGVEIRDFDLERMGFSLSVLDESKKKQLSEAYLRMRRARPESRGEESSFANPPTRAFSRHVSGLPQRPTCRLSRRYNFRRTDGQEGGVCIWSR